MMKKRMGPEKKAKEIEKYFKKEDPDYGYLKSVFVALRKKLGIKSDRTPKRQPYIPSEEEVQKFYNTVWKSENVQDALITKLMIYTGIRVSELVRIRIGDVDLEKCQIEISTENGKNSRRVSFPRSFRETLGMHILSMRKKGADHLFESVRNRCYSQAGIRKMLERYRKMCGMDGKISPHKFRHFLFTWMKKEGVEDEFILHYTSIKKQESIKLYADLAIEHNHKIYEEKIKNFPV